MSTDLRMNTDVSRQSDAVASERLQIWDLPVRLFHWALVLLLAMAWWTAENGVLDWHRRAGYAILTLVLFRVLWGFFGSSTARFSHFLRGPITVGGYVRHSLFGRSPATQAGHNPLGGWSVMAMLGLIAVQVILGFFAVDVDGIESGPYSYLVDFETGRAAAEWHELVFNLLLALIALHVLAILYYALGKRDNLVGPMIRGGRPWSGERPALRFAPLYLALGLFLVSALTVWVAVSFFGQV